MGREQDLERQLSELKKSKESLLSKIDVCMNVNDQQKARVYDQVVPLIRTAIEQKTKNGVWVEKCEDGIDRIVFDKLLKAVFGDEVRENLGRV